MALVEVEKCSEINCKYLNIPRYCPEDLYDYSRYADCYHPNAPYLRSLGDDSDKDYLKIPDWCPRRVDKV